MVSALWFFLSVSLMFLSLVALDVLFRLSRRHSRYAHPWRYFRWRMMRRCQSLHIVWMKFSHGAGQTVRYGGIEISAQTQLNRIFKRLSVLNIFSQIMIPPLTRESC